MDMGCTAPRCSAPVDDIELSLLLSFGSQICQSQPVLCAGAQLTVRQACHLFLSMKRAHCQRDTHFDISVRLLANVLLPVGNILPPSLHLMEAVVGVKPPASCAHHVCRNDCYSWEHLPHTQWQAHQDDQCPICMEDRFIRRTASDTPCLKPAKVCSL